MPNKMKIKIVHKWLDLENFQTNCLSFEIGEYQNCEISRLWGQNL